MKKIVVSILIGIMLISSLSANASANFTDVNEADWYYDTVTEMTNEGLFKGKGNNMFCPNDTMTKAEFITVTMRILYPNTDFTANGGQAWWEPVYKVAIEKGLITESEFPISSMEQTISRQEMALVSSKALIKKGEIVFALSDTSKKIPDYYQIDKPYVKYVEMAYSMGILCGVDDRGTFAPDQTLTRAEAATVLYRIINPSSRKPLRLTNPGTSPQSDDVKILTGDLAGLMRGDVATKYDFQALETARFYKENDKLYVSVDFPELPDGFKWEYSIDVYTKDGSSVYSVTDSNCTGKQVIEVNSEHVDNTVAEIHRATLMVRVMNNERKSIVLHKLSTDNPNEVFRLSLLNANNSAWEDFDTSEIFGW